jgi:hypothetical protein
LRKIEEARTPFLVVVGASGSEKSSLLRAGLGTRIIRQGTIAYSCRTAHVIPTGDPRAVLLRFRSTEAATSVRVIARSRLADDHQSPLYEQSEI